MEGDMGSDFLLAENLGTQRFQAPMVGLNHLPVSKVGRVKWVGQPLKQGVSLARFGFVDRKNAKSLGMTLDHFGKIEEANHHLKRMADEKNVFFQLV
jgi:hypothetical protein